MIGLTVMLSLAAVTILFVIAVYNKLVALRNRFKNAFAQIDVQLKRRYDLIPNLVETAKKYLAHERETLEAVIAARSSANGAREQAAQHPESAAAMKGLAGADAALTGALGKLMVLQEAYPDLKSNQTMGQLMEELSSTENKVGFSRQAFNDAVMAYNIAREQFPGSFIANSFNFQPAELFQVENPEERKAVKVSFS